MGVRLPEVYIDAKALLNGVLSESKTILIGSYNSDFKEIGELKHFHIVPKNAMGEDDISTLDMTLTYEVMVKMGTDFIKTEVSNDFALLNTKGDYKWNRSLKYKVWEGNYPSTVGIDKRSGDVYLVHLYKDNAFEMQYFSTLSANELDLVKCDLNTANPYKLTIDSESMFDYIAGDEGLNYLKKNIVIELDCGMPLKVKKGE